MYTGKEKQKIPRKTQIQRMEGELTAKKKKKRKTRAKLRLIIELLSERKVLHTFECKYT